MSGFQICRLGWFSNSLLQIFESSPQWAGFWEPEGSKYISFLLHISFMVPSLTPLETTFSSSFVSLTLLSGRARTTSPPLSKFFISAQAETSVSKIELMNLSVHPPSPFQLLLGRAMLGLVPPVGYGSPLLLQTGCGLHFVHLMEKLSIKSHMLSK